MSTNQQELDPNAVAPELSHLISTGSIARSILNPGDLGDRRMQPEDMRTRRFGYNPGWKMQMDPVLSGLQTNLIQPGVLLLFETSPISRQNPSVDKDDRTPPNILTELLAGHALGNVAFQNEALGFRELLPIRGKGNQEAVSLFYHVHPTLQECVEHKVIPPCLYPEQDVCMTCRAGFFKTLNVNSVAGEVLKVLKESVSVGRSEMAVRWGTNVSEVASTRAGVNRDIALGALTDDHTFMMKQLHARTPEDMELAKIAAQSDAQARVMEEQFQRQADRMAEAIKGGRAEESAVKKMQDQMDQMAKKIEQLTKKGLDNKVPE